ncbi:Inorganic triphosphatase YgiF, contains CYTH and CHAD domains [Arboricoccus pini]|uniref:Inorganic triphosphatase YgiF, contains CYTH and CHAD domains n=1 Tax=Arboricoccus pini TaxID=1963835 RepID=A0A212QAJ3_9PROT|nr:CYTH and CHAD domain-containing protein [Arboricoccus pini]SNB56428.1 Inorganic triphosphatase YgiF, contains CYTH and CHAD domains [Arboricoccus pini]
MSPDSPLPEPPLEVELKLRSTEAGMASLATCELLTRHSRTPLKRGKLKSIYFDTPDFRLAQQGLALRIRKDGRRLIQTVKGEAITSSIAKDRPEWEVDLKEARPDLKAFGDGTLLDRVGVVLPEELEALFESVVERSRTLLDWTDQAGRGAVIEVAFDNGSIVGKGRRQVFSELELELKEGSSQALYELADALRGVAPLAIETVSKAGRGYGLVAGLTPGPRKAGSPELDQDMQVEEGMRRIFRSALSHLLDNEQSAEIGRDPEGVHQMRVALRRLRSALTIFQPAIGQAAAQRWNEEFRWLIGRLGPARDLDVFDKDMLASIDSGEPGKVPLATLQALTAEARGKAYDQVRATLKGDRYAEMALGFALWVELAKWREEGGDPAVFATPLGGFAVETLEKRYRRLLKRGRHFDHLGDESRHEMRKTLKKLRYGVEYFGGLFESEQMRAFARKLADFQDELGHLNDVAVAAGLALSLAGRRDGPGARHAAIGAGIVVGWHAAAADGHKRRASINWRAFRQTTPFWREARS